MAEVEANRDYYGPVRFDDINFQMSAQGQQLQARFVETYADRLHDDIEGQLTLPEFAPVSRPAVTSQGSVRARGPSGGGGSGSLGPAPDTSGISEEVRGAQARGRRLIGQSRGNLDVVTRGAKGASEKAADDVKEW
ncbi:hypothetical protein [Sphingobium xenophagum]|uniref:hypothetical protein n=1 Tax=Sphingobium xenophagum TaxID=121428 RepID=UPI0002F77EAD|nr:hypothetical protein [Sphingobium xenophagum]